MPSFKHLLQAFNKNGNVVILGSNFVGNMITRHRSSISPISSESNTLPSKKRKYRSRSVINNDGRQTLEVAPNQSYLDKRTLHNLSTSFYRAVVTKRPSALIKSPYVSHALFHYAFLLFSISQIFFN